MSGERWEKNRMGPRTYSQADVDVLIEENMRLRAILEQIVVLYSHGGSVEALAMIAAAEVGHASRV